MAVGGEIQFTKCRRFTLVTGSQHYTLLDRGVPVHRNVREDLAKKEAQNIVDAEAKCQE